MILCCRDHEWLYGYRPPAPRPFPVRHAGLSQWLMCQLVHYPTAVNLALLVGVLNADEDGAPLYFRARFWRPTIWRRYALAELAKENP